MRWFISYFLLGIRKCNHAGGVGIATSPAATHLHASLSASRALGPAEAFGWGCLRGLHNDRGSPNLTLRLATGRSRK